MTEEQEKDQSTPQPPDATPPSPLPQSGAPQPPVSGQMPPQQPLYNAQQPQVPCPPAPLMQLTGGMKFAWLVVGALMGISGIIISWLVNVDKMPQVKSDALKFSIIGFVIRIVLGFLIGLIIFGAISAALYGMTGTAGSYGYRYGYW